MNKEISERLRSLSDLIFYQCLQLEILKAFVALEESDKTDLKKFKALHLFQSNTMSIAILNHLKLINANEKMSLTKFVTLIINNHKKINWAHHSISLKKLQEQLLELKKLESETKTTNLKDIRDKMIAHSDNAIEKLHFHLDWLTEPIEVMKKIYNELCLAINGSTVYFDLPNESGVDVVFNVLKFYTKLWLEIIERKKSLKDEISIWEIQRMMMGERPK